MQLYFPLPCRRRFSLVDDLDVIFISYFYPAMIYAVTSVPKKLGSEHKSRQIIVVSEPRFYGFWILISIFFYLCIQQFYPFGSQNIHLSSIHLSIHPSTHKSYSSRPPSTPTILRTLSSPDLSHSSKGSPEHGFHQ